MHPTPHFRSEFEPMLRAFIEGRAEHWEIDHIIRESIGFCVDWLRQAVWSRSWNFEDTGLDIRDLAFDLVAELLAEGDEGPCTELRRGMRNTISRNAGMIPAFGAFRAVLLTTLSQRISRCFAVCDPLKARMLGRIRKHVARSVTIIATTAPSGRWYVRAGREDTLRHPGRSWVDLLHLATSVSTGKYFEYDLLDGLLTRLATLPDTRCAVSESDFLALAAELLHSRFLASANEQDDIDEEERTELLIVIDEVISTFRPWIEAKFLRPGKLTEDEAEAILKAGRLYLCDAMDGDTDSIYQYMHEVLPHLTHAEYRRDYHNRCGYILNKLFTTVGERILYLHHEGESRAEASR